MPLAEAELGLEATGEIDWCHVSVSNTLLLKLTYREGSGKSTQRQRQGTQQAATRTTAWKIK